MRTMNTNEDLPEFFYIFVDGLSPVQKINFKLRNGIVSGAFLNLGLANGDFLSKYQSGEVDYLPFVNNTETDINSPSSYNLAVTRDYTLEYNAELARKYYDKTKKYPCRLSCVYAFGDMDTCNKVSEMYGWNINTVRKFKIEPDFEQLKLTRVIKVNMEVVSLMRSIGWSASFSQKDQDSIWRHYWGGGDNLQLEIHEDDMSTRKIVESGLIWEYLIEGRLNQVSNKH